MNDTALSAINRVALEHTAGMLIAGAVILLVAVSIDHFVASRERSRMEAWRRKRDK